jgi:hypothetical protein
MFAPKAARPQMKAAADLTNGRAHQRAATLAAHRPGQGLAARPNLLQRGVGDAATIQDLTRWPVHSSTRDIGEQHETNTGRSARNAPVVSWDFSGVSAFAPDRADRPRPSPASAAPRLPHALQAKLIVGQVNDPLEYEADSVADQVMRMADPVFAINASPSRVSRKCAACEEEEQETLRTKRAETGGATSGEAPAIVHDVLRAPGQPLDPASREFFEPRFGRDFSGVRVHSGARAAESARLVGARAYTVRENIVFGAGRHSPNTYAGQALLAHELTHVVQQGKAGPGTLARARTSRDSSDWLRRQPADAPVHDTPVSFEESPAQRAGVPYEKWAKEIEQQYRTRGDIPRANAIRACREQGLDGCAWLLTADEAQRMFALAKESAGDETKIRLGLVGAAPLLARQLARAAPALAPAPVAPSAGPMLTPGAVAGPAALAAVVVLTSYLLWTIGQFQDKLRAKGFVILEDPLALCVGGCHMPGPKAGPSIPDFPGLTPDQLKDWATKPDAGPQSEPSPKTKPAPEEDCYTAHPGASECEDFRSRDDAIRGFLGPGASNIRIGRCTSMGKFTQEDQIAACLDGPGESWHCDVSFMRNGKRQTIVISIFACICCHEDGASGIEWKNPHPGGR